ncbi:MAG TPA: STAS domain-containing protein [Acidimicrobiales bacterium]|nr:STAS domain-containing protein [Acidimicrobiales bacterium]
MTNHGPTERSGTRAGGGDAVPWPAGLSVAIGRALGTVVVTVRGALEDCAAEPLRRVLGDLVDDQGNRRVVVDLRAASPISAAVREVFAAVDASARRRGSSLCLHGPDDEPAVPNARAYLRPSLE